jgi:flagellar protein FliS
MNGGTGVQRYLEADINSITMEKMIVLLYERMIRDLTEAAAAAASGDRPGMIGHVNHAQLIITELNNALDHTAGGTVAANLEALYDFLFRENLEFLVDQDPVHAENCLRVLGPLLEAWSGIPGGTAGSGGRPGETPSTTAEAEEPAEAAGPATHRAESSPSLFSVSA